MHQAVASAGELTLTTDMADDAPGSEGTITASGFRVGAAVRFSLRDLASDPGVDGELDDDGSCAVMDGGADDLDGAANGVLIARWTVLATNSGQPSSTPDAFYGTVWLTAQELQAGPSGQIDAADALGIGPVAVHLLFTDAGVEDTTAPTLTGQYPSAGTTGVPINHSLILTLSEALVANGGTVKAQLNASLTLSWE